MVTTASLILHETETLILLLSSGSLDHLAGWPSFVLVKAGSIWISWMGERKEKMIKSQEQLMEPWPRRRRDKPRRTEKTRCFRKWIWLRGCAQMKPATPSGRKGDCKMSSPKSRYLFCESRNRAICSVNTPWKNRGDWGREERLRSFDDRRVVWGQLWRRMQ